MTQEERRQALAELLPEMTPQLERRLRNAYYDAPPQLGELYPNDDGVGPDMVRRPSRHTGVRAVYELIRSGELENPAS